MGDGVHARRCGAEAVGTMLLLACVVGSGIMAERLAGGNGALALLANSLATGAGLAALILALGPVSGAHFNPVVTLAAVVAGELSPRRAGGYLAAQLAGALAGTVLAHAMFGLPLVTPSQTARPGGALALAEAAATFGLVLVVRGTAGRSTAAVAVAVGAYITAAYWFTSSTSFANPAVTVARALTDTFTGIRPVDVPAFVVAQCAGAAVAVAVTRWLRAAGGEGAQR